MLVGLEPVDDSPLPATVAVGSPSAIATALLTFVATTFLLMSCSTLFCFAFLLQTCVYKLPAPEALDDRLEVVAFVVTSIALRPAVDRLSL